MFITVLFLRSFGEDIGDRVEGGREEGVGEEKERKIPSLHPPPSTLSPLFYALNNSDIGNGKISPSELFPVATISNLSTPRAFPKLGFRMDANS